MFRGAFWRGGREGGGGQFSLIDLAASAGAEQISDTKCDFARYHVTFLSMVHFFENLFGRALIKKVGENDGRVAKNEMLESFCPILGNNSIFSSSVSPAREATF